ncbi:MAG: ABC transporter substrate-binding protein [Thiotrichales bacterium]|nr:ABC transporter substrate-binding protein [Thiotrichales bacterium]
MRVLSGRCGAGALAIGPGVGTGLRRQGHVVLAQYGYGRTDAADGRVWPWVFNAASHYWSQIAVKMKFMAEQEGGIDKMKGKKIVHLHIDSAYGREPLPAMRKIADDWGVELVEISIPPPGLEQQSQWLQIRKERPDWVTFWGAGSGMNSTAMTNAARVGFPRDRMIYVTFGAAEEDMYPAGESAKGTYAMANALPGDHFPLVQRIKEQVYGAGKFAMMQWDGQKIRTGHGLGCSAGPRFHPPTGGGFRGQVRQREQHRAQAVLVTQQFPVDG